MFFLKMFFGIGSRRNLGQYNKLKCQVDRIDLSQEVIYKSDNHCV